MVVKTAYMIAITRRENVIGVALMVGAVDFFGKEMDVMALLEDQVVINVRLNQVSTCLSEFSIYWLFLCSTYFFK